MQVQLGVVHACVGRRRALLAVRGPITELAQLIDL